MNSGNIREEKFNFNVNLNDYLGMHRDRKCNGHWDITVTINGRCTLDALGPVLIPLIPMVTCHKCQTSYEIPKFRQFIESIIARHLIESKYVFDKKQIRFLRLYFDFTQEEFAKHIGVADKHEMAKFESESFQRTLGVDRQIRLKLFGAKLLKIKDAGKILAFNEIDDSAVTEISADIFPKTEEELAQKVG